jgi:hypothetical protein
MSTQIASQALVLFPAGYYDDTTCTKCPNVSGTCTSNQVKAQEPI